MNGPDSISASNMSLLSRLSRTQSSRSSIGRVNPSISQERLSRKNSEKDNHKALVQSTRWPSPLSNRYKPKELSERISNGPNIYQIGAEIGRGAFAVVYQAFNVETGDFVAVKRFPLTAIDDDSLGSIQSEIELMQRLNHPNIVKYIDTIRTENYLYIVIEYIENGSLSTVLKKFGSFSEPLVAIYVKQILRGLKYLHEQGALHRDIKGANILTTKDGHVKLADFGVAIKLTEASNIYSKGNIEDAQNVVGSPYWIAPEIIEMATPTAACDIWSVGCTVIELLTGKPPYYSRRPMAALFAIVQDEHPPLPDGISTTIKDFLLLCFQKDPAMRSSAAVLLNHPWLQQTGQIHNTPRTSKSPPTDRSLMSSMAKSPKRRQSIRDTQQDTVSRCASAESSPTLADRNTRLSDHTYFSEVIISPRYVLDAAAAKERKNHKEDSNSNASDSSRSSDQSSIERSLLLREAALLRSDTEELRMASCAKEAAIALNSVSLDIVGPSADEVTVRRTSSRLSTATNEFSRMMSFELPYEKESASGWSSCDSIGASNVWDQGLGLGPAPITYRRTESGKLGGFGGMGASLSTLPPMLSTKQVSSMTASCSSFRPPSLPSSLPSSSNNSIAGPDAEDDHDSHEVMTRIVTSGVLSSTEPRMIGDLVDDDSSGALDDSDDMRLSLDDEVDERRGLNILRKSLKSASFLDIDCNSSPVWSENEEDVPQLTLSLKRPDDVEGSKDFRQNNSNSFADELRVRMSVANSRSISSFDAFDESSLKPVDFDDEFDSYENKDVNMNRSKEVVAIMGKITPGCSTGDVVINCKKLLNIFSTHPEIKEHLITHFGVTPILEMFEATQCRPQAHRGYSTASMNFDPINSRSSSVLTDNSTATSSSYAEFTVDVLLVVNKITEGSIRSLEQLTMMGILPGILRLLEETSSVIVAIKENERRFVASRDKPPSYTSMAFSTFLPNSLLLTSPPNMDCRKDRLEVPPSAMEAARFIHKISSASSMTLQILVGAGGLSAVVNMISFSKLMSVEGVSPIRNEIFLGSDGNTDCGATASSFSSGATTTSSSFNLRPTLPRMSFFASLPIHATSSSPPSVPEDTSVQLESAEACEEADTNPQQPPLSHLPSPPPTRDVAAASVLSNISATALSEAATAALDRESPRGDSASIPFHIPETTASSLNGGHASIKSFSPASAITSTVSEDAKLMVYMGVDCVIEIFSVQSSRTRDFCRLFVKLGLLRHISLAFDCVYTLVRQTTICCSPSCLAGQRKRRGTNSKCNSVTSVKGHERKGSDFSDHSVISKPEISSCNQECRYLSNIASIFLKISRSDAPVALQMASDTQVITSIMAVLKDPRLLTPVWNNQGNVSTCSTESRNSYLTNISGKSHACMSILGLSPCTVGIIETLLKCLKNLSMESSALADLEKAGIIPTLVSLLGGPVSIRCKNHIVPCIFNMCRINKRRQEDAVMHGLIPHLQSLILNDSQMKQFALPILCSLAYTSATTRAELLKCGGAAFYINLLKENYWQTFALNSLAVWLANDTEYIENLLVEPDHLTRLVDFFRTASPIIIRVLHEPFLDMMSKSAVLSRALSNSGLYVTSLVKRLCTSDAMVLRSLLKMVQLLHQYHPNPRQFVLDNDLYNIAKGFAQSEVQVLVHQIANRLLTDFQNSTLT